MHACFLQFSVVAEFDLFCQVFLQEEDVVFHEAELSVHCIELIHEVVTPGEDFRVDDLVHLLLGRSELILEVQELAVLDVDQVFILEHLSDEVVASVTHFYLTVLDERSAAFFQALVQVLAGDDHADAGCERLNLQAPVLDLREHFLDWTDFVDNVQVVPSIFHHIKSARKLLSWMNEGLHLQIGQFEYLGERLRLILEHFERNSDHVFLQLGVNDFNLA